MTAAPNLAIGGGDAERLLARWWCSYDAADFDDLTALLADGASFRCRTDTGTTDFEDFVRADLRGRDAVMAWQVEHRLDSPFPLRHHATNFHLTGEGADGSVTFRHYLTVAAVANLVPAPVPGGVVMGTLRRDAQGALRIAVLVVVLDTTDSVPLRSLRAEDPDPTEEPTP